MRIRSWFVTLAALSVAAAVTACGPPSDSGDDNDSGGGANAKTATSANLLKLASDVAA